MSAHHFFADATDISDDVVVLRGDEAHHAARSLRVTVGERITVADGAGLVVSAIVRSISSTVEADIVDRGTADPLRPGIVLHQAVSKLDKLEFVVEKAAELGVERVVPFIAERSVVRWDERKLARVKERLTAIAFAAAKQCRSPFVLEVDPVTSHLSVDPPCIVLHEEATIRLRDALPPDAPRTLSVVVGPEGGLASAEVEALSDRGAVAVSLGDRILRTETAGLVAASVIAYTYGWIG